MKTGFRAYAVTIGKEFCAWGNGNQFQYPIFTTRKEAKSWVNEHMLKEDLQIEEILIIRGID
jgi:hypothetical protein